MCPPGYGVTYIPRTTGRGGVAFVYKKCFKVLLQKNIQLKSMENIDITCNCNSETYRVIVVYRPTSSSKYSPHFNALIKEFNNMLESCMLANGKLIVLGDFNIQMDDTTSTNASKFGDLLREYGLHQYVSGPTHNWGHMLDLVITRSPSDINNITPQDPLISDHELISFFIKSQDPETKLQLKKLFIEDTRYWTWTTFVQIFPL